MYVELLNTFTAKFIGVSEFEGAAVEAGLLGEVVGVCSEVFDTMFFTGFGHS